MSRAGDLPSEILDRILYFVASDSYHSSGGVTNKTGLCHCSLTCRYWAERTAPALFDTIVLKSQDDLRMLLDAISTSKRHLSRYVKALHVTHGDESYKKPWVHHVLLSLSHKLPSLSQLVYADISESPKTHPHPLLPKRLPAFFSAFVNVEELWLQDHRLHSFADLVHLVGRLPQLRSLSCANMNWKNQPQHMPESRAQVPSRLHAVNMLFCRTVWPAIWFFIAPAVSRKRKPRFSPDDPLVLALQSQHADVINNVICCFLSDERMQSSSYSLAKADESTWHLKCVNTNATIAPDSPRSEEPCVPDIIFVLKTVSLVTSIDKHEMHIERIEFERFRDMSNPYRTASLALLDWGCLVGILTEAGLTQVKVIIRLDAENEFQIASCEEPEDAIQAKMPVQIGTAGDEENPYVFHRVGWERREKHNEPAGSETN